MAKRWIIGWVNGRPVYTLRGADGEMSLIIDDGDDGDDDLDDDEDDDGGEDGDAGASASTASGRDDWPPTREEWERLRSTARNATRQAVRRKRIMREHGLSPGGKTVASAEKKPESGEKKTAAGDAGPSDREAALAEARERSQREERLAGGLKRKALQAELREAGWIGEDFPLVARMIDFEAVEVDFDDAGDPVITGLADQVESIRGEIPAWFKKTTKQAEKKKPTERAGAESVDGGHKPAPPAPRAGWRQQVSNQLGGVVRR
jgi:hypothetical protein